MSRFASRSNPEQAARPSDRGRPAAERSDRRRRECTRLVQAALDLLERGDVRGARELLARILTPANGTRYPWGAAWTTRVLSQRVSRPREQPRTPDQGTQIAKLPSAATPAVIEARPAPIRIRALGGFDLTIDGVAFASGVKPQRRPLDLLKVLVVSNGHSIGAAE